MDLALQSRFYANVPVWLWPFVFAQLLALTMQCDRSGRQEGLLSICRVTGRVDILFLCDDARAPKAWRPEQVWDFVRPMTVRLAYTSVDAREGGYPWANLFPSTSSQLVTYRPPPARELAGLELPALQDSS
ncbi:MAG: hypothetical protein AAFZ91_09220 [Pseudomonadota bacterium]